MARIDQLYFNERTTARDEEEDRLLNQIRLKEQGGQEPGAEQQPKVQQGQPAPLPPDQMQTQKIIEELKKGTPREQIEYEWGMGGGELTEPSQLLDPVNLMVDVVTGGVTAPARMAGKSLVKTVGKSIASNVGYGLLGSASVDIAQKALNAGPYLQMLAGVIGPTATMAVLTLGRRGIAEVLEHVRFNNPKAYQELETAVQKQTKIKGSVEDILLNALSKDDPDTQAISRIKEVYGVKDEKEAQAILDAYKSEESVPFVHYSDVEDIGHTLDPNKMKGARGEEGKAIANGYDVTKRSYGYPVGAKKEGVIPSTGVAIGVGQGKILKGKSKEARDLLEEAKALIKTEGKYAPGDTVAAQEKLYQLATERGYTVIDTGTNLGYKFLGPQKVISLSPKKMGDLVDYAVKNGGATYNLVLDQHATKGISSSIEGNEVRVPLKDFTPQKLQQYIVDKVKLLVRPDNNLGLWKDGEEMVMNVSKTFDDTKIGVTFGINNHQKAVYDINTDTEIPTLGKTVDQVMEENPYLKARTKFAEGTPSAPGTHGRVNMEYINTEDRVKKMVNEVNKLNGVAIEEQARGTITHAQTIAASKGKMTVDQALAIEPGTALRGDEIHALQEIRTSAFVALENAMKLAKNGNEDAKNSLPFLLELAGNLEVKAAGGRAEAGRTLEALKIPTEGMDTVMDIRSAAELAKSVNGKNIDPDELLRRLETLTDDQKKVMLKQVGKAGLRDVFLEAWINGLLTGPKTHLANFLGNLTTTVMAPMERGMAAAMSGGKNVSFNEVGAMIHGGILGFMDGIKLAGKALVEGAERTKLDIAREPAITAKNFDLTGPLGRAVDLIGTFVRLPGRGLIASDEFFKAINYRMELHAQAARQAVNEGKTGDSLGKRIVEILEDPPTRIKEAADNFKFYQTFQGELGPWGQTFARIGELKAAGFPIGKLILPFTKTPANILRYAGEHSPAGLVMLREEIKKGGASRDLALAKVSLGSMIMASAAYLAANGYVTGKGPRDKNLRREMQADGWQPYSVKVGNRYYSYNRLDPLGMTFSLAATFTEMAGQLDDATLDEMATVAAVSIADSVTSKNYLVGLSNVMDAIQEPTGPGAGFVQRMARSIVPAGIAQIEQTIDPTVRDAWTMFENIQSRVPGFSDKLPPLRNIFGEPIALGGGLGPDLISPVYSSTRKNDPVVNEIIKNKVSLSMPGKYVGGAHPPQDPTMKVPSLEGVELTHDEYDRYVMLAGNELKMGGLGMKDQLAKLMKSDVYQKATNGPDGGKAAIIRKVVMSYREAALEKLQDEVPDLRMKIQDKKMQRVQRKYGGM